MTANVDLEPDFLYTTIPDIDLEPDFPYTATKGYNNKRVQQQVLLYSFVVEPLCC